MLCTYILQIFRSKRVALSTKFCNWLSRFFLRASKFCLVCFRLRQFSLTKKTAGCKNRQKVFFSKSIMLQPKSYYEGKQEGIGSKIQDVNIIVNSQRFLSSKHVITFSIFLSSCFTNAFRRCGLVLNHC